MMTNPETDALGEVENYLIAIGGTWALAVSNLRLSVPDSAEYEREIRDLAKRALALRQ